MVCFFSMFYKVTLLVLIKFNNVILYHLFKRFYSIKAKSFKVVMANFIEKISLAPLLL